MADSLESRSGEQRRIREYVLLRLGHCEDCATTEAFNDAADPYHLEELPPCDCCYSTVEGLFDEMEQGTA